MASVQRVEGEINKKIAQLRQIMDEIKEVKRAQQSVPLQYSQEVSMSNDKVR